MMGISLFPILCTESICELKKQDDDIFPFLDQRNMHTHIHTIHTYKYTQFISKSYNDPEIIIHDMILHKKRS